MVKICFACGTRDNILELNHNDSKEFFKNIKFLDPHKRRYICMMCFLKFNKIAKNDNETEPACNTHNQLLIEEEVRSQTEPSSSSDVTFIENEIESGTTPSSSCDVTAVNDQLNRNTTRKPKTFLYGYACHICGLLLHNQRKMAKHSREEHNKVINRSSLIRDSKITDSKQCATCGGRVMMSLYSKHKKCMHTSSVKNSHQEKVNLQLPELPSSSIINVAEDEGLPQVVIKNEIKCKYCKYSFCFAATYQNHLNRHHKGKYYCQDCSEDCPNKFVFIRHKRCHQNLSEIQKICNVCFLICDNRKVLAKHHKEKHTSSVIKCILCNYSCTNMNQLKMHKRSQHWSTRDSVRKASESNSGAKSALIDDSLLSRIIKDMNFSANNEDTFDLATQSNETVMPRSTESENRPHQETDPAECAEDSDSFYNYCLKCKTHIPDWNFFTKHNAMCARFELIKSTYYNEPSRVCNECHGIFPDLTKAWQHRKQCHGIQSSKKGIISTDDRNLNSTPQPACQQGNESCKFCGIVFHHEAFLKDHIQQVHSGGSDALPNSDKYTSTSQAVGHSTGLDQAENMIPCKQNKQTMNVSEDFTGEDVNTYPTNECSTPRVQNMPSSKTQLFNRISTSEHYSANWHNVVKKFTDVPENSCPTSNKPSTSKTQNVIHSKNQKNTEYSEWKNRKNTVGGEIAHVSENSSFTGCKSSVPIKQNGDHFKTKRFNKSSSLPYKHNNVHDGNNHVAENSYPRNNKQFSYRPDGIPKRRSSYQSDNRWSYDKREQYCEPSQSSSRGRQNREQPYRFRRYFDFN